MRDEDRVRILHMIDAAETVAQFVAGRSRDDLDRDRMLLFALVHAIEILGEAANKVSADGAVGRTADTVAAHRLDAQPAHPRLLRYRYDNRLEDGYGGGANPASSAPRVG